MREILDEPESKDESSKLFSRLGIITSIVSLFFGSRLNAYIKTRDLAIEDTISYPRPFAIGLFISILLGIILSGISFYRKEPHSLIKWIGGISNLLFFVLFYGAIIFAMFAYT